MTIKALNIALTFDAEMDAFDKSITVEDAITWRGIEQGIPVIEDVLNSVEDSCGGRACATWFVRCDDHVGHMTGSIAYLFEYFGDLWRKHQRMGDEIAFHPHLYRQENGVWKQDTEPTTLRAQIFRALEAMRVTGFQSRVSRIGEAFGSNAVMSALEEAGMGCDSTAMPGRVRMDAERSLDWGDTPSCAYHPSEHDYRVPGEPARRLREVPLSMISTLADYDRKPLLRYLDFSFHRRVLEPGLPELVARSEIVVSVTHPSTVLSGHPAHGLISFSADVFAQNIQLLLQECVRQKRPFQFITLRNCMGERYF